jgi:hypothetical protein
MLNNTSLPSVMQVSVVKFYTKNTPQNEGHFLLINRPNVLL